MNKVTLIGILAKAPTIKHSDVHSLCRLKIKTTDANNRNAQYHRVSVYGLQGQDIAQSAKKGDRIHIQGELKNKRLTNHNTGRWRFTSEVVVTRVQGSAILITDEATNPLTHDVNSVSIRGQICSEPRYWFNGLRDQVAEFKIAVICKDETLISNTILEQQLFNVRLVNLHKLPIGRFGKGDRIQLIGKMVNTEDSQPARFIEIRPRQGSARVLSKKAA